jgi:hypothetical protein
MCDAACPRRQPILDHDRSACLAVETVGGGEQIRGRRSSLADEDVRGANFLRVVGEAGSGSGQVDRWDNMPALTTSLAMPLAGDQ